jgi:hypothetical protein
MQIKYSSWIFISAVIAIEFLSEINFFSFFGPMDEIYPPFLAYLLLPFMSTGTM